MIMHTLISFFHFRDDGEKQILFYFAWNTFTFILFEELSLPLLFEKFSLLLCVKNFYWIDLDLYTS